MKIISVLVRKEIAEQTRSKKIIVLFIVFIFLALASPILAKLMPQIFKNFSGQGGITITMPEPTFMDAVDQFVKNASQMVLYLLIFVVAGSVVDEKIRKTLEMVLVKPLSRSSFILSKFLAYFLTVTLFFFASSLIFYLYTVSIFESFNFVSFMSVSALILLYILLVLAVTIFTSTISKSVAVAGVVGFTSTFVLSSILGSISQAADYSPGYILVHYRELINIGWDTGFAPPTLISLFLIASLVLLSVYSFRNQEIER